MPDGWGCLLLDRQLQKKGLSLQQITPLQRLSMIGLNAMGALEYEPITENDSEFVGDIELDSLCLEANHILAGKSSEVLDKLLTLNGSSGGARPKIVALVSDDKQTLIHGNLAKPGYSPWLIKLPLLLIIKTSALRNMFTQRWPKTPALKCRKRICFPRKTTSVISASNVLTGLATKRYISILPAGYCMPTTAHPALTMTVY